MNITCASHLEPMFNLTKRTELIKSAVALVRKKKLDFTSIAGTGLSGTIFASLLAHRLKKNLIIVRKGEKTHSNYKVEGLCWGENKILIVDDLICSGASIRRIKEEIGKARKRQSETKIQYLPYGILYNNCDRPCEEIYFIDISID